MLDIDTEYNEPTQTINFEVENSEYNKIEQFAIDNNITTKEIIFTASHNNLKKAIYSYLYNPNN